MKKLFSNNIFIFGYFFLLGLIGLTTKKYFKGLLDKYGTFTIMVVEAFMELIVLIPVGLFRSRNSNLKTITECKQFSFKEISYLFFIALFGIGTGFIGTEFVKKNEISKLMIIDILIGVLISFVGMYFYENKNISKKHMLGLFLICVGSYFLF